MRRRVAGGSLQTSSSRIWKKGKEDKLLSHGGEKMRTKNINLLDFPCRFLSLSPPHPRAMRSFLRCRVNVGPTFRTRCERATFGCAAPVISYYEGGEEYFLICLALGVKRGKGEFEICFAPLLTSLFFFKAVSLHAGLMLRRKDFHSISECSDGERERAKTRPCLNICLEGQSNTQY